MTHANPWGKTAIFAPPGAIRRDSRFNGKRGGRTGFTRTLRFTSAMTNGVISLDEVTSSGTDSTSTESETDDGDHSDLREACEAIGADFDHATEYVAVHGNEEDLVEFASKLAQDEDLWELQEEYRRMNDIHRIIRNHLRSHDLEFTEYTGRFYGDSDDPEPGTYNHVQQRSRAAEGNLMWYRALFPEPVTEYWDGSAVLWQEFDEIGYDDDGDLQDSHIYVTEDFVTEYADFKIEVNGKEVPRPPANSELNTSSGGASGSNGGSDDLTEISGIGAQFESKLNDMGIHTRADLAAADPSEVSAEVGGASESMVEQWQDQLDVEPTEQSDLSDFDAEEVEKLVDAGFSRDEVLEMLG